MRGLRDDERFAHALCTERRMPTVPRTARSVFNVGFPEGASERYSASRLNAALRLRSRGAAPTRPSSCSWLPPFPVGPECLGRFDVFRLSPLRAAGQQNDDCPATATEVDPPARAEMLAKFEDAITWISHEFRGEATYARVGPRQARVPGRLQRGAAINRSVRERRCPASHRGPACAGTVARHAPECRPGIVGIRNPLKKWSLRESRGGSPLRWSAVQLLPQGDRKSVV